MEKALCGVGKKCLEGLRRDSMKKAIPYFLILLLSVFLSGCGSEPANMSVVECSEDLSPVMGCDIKAGGKLECTNPPEILQRILPSIQIVIIEGATKLYKSMNTQAFQRIVSAVLILYLVMYGFWVAAGFTELQLGNVIQRLIRIAIIGFLLSPTGTEFYFGIMEKIWITAPDELMNVLIAPIIDSKDFIMNENITSHQNILEEIFKVIEGAKDSKIDSTGSSGIVGLPFVMLDVLFATIFSPRAIAFYVALWTYGVAGKLLLLVVVFGLAVFMITICKAIWEYVIALLFRTVLIGIGFVFILLSLFTKTREVFFGAWILRLLTYTFQPIFLFAFLGVITVIVNVAFLDLTEGKFYSGEPRATSDRGMQMTKNRACYHEYEASILYVIPYDTWAWRFCKHDASRSIITPYFDINENWSEAVFMIFLFVGVVWMGYKGTDAAKMIPKLMFAFAPISAESAVGLTNLPGLAGQTKDSIIGTSWTAFSQGARTLNPREREALIDYQYQKAAYEASGMGRRRSAWLATKGVIAGKGIRFEGAVENKWKSSWNKYFKETS